MCIRDRHWTVLQSPDCCLFHKRSPTSRIDYGDRVSRLIYSRFYFFKKHLPKDLRHTAAWAWSSVGISALYLGIAVQKKGEGGSVVRGVARGYRRCVADLLGRDPS